jgi:hypothetical protein
MGDDTLTTKPANDTGRSEGTQRLVLPAVALLIGIAAGFFLGRWYESRPDPTESWCETAEAVMRTARAGAPWAEAVDEWTLAQNQPTWAHDYNSFEVLYGVDTSTREGTDAQAQEWVIQDLAVCDSRR